jgi:hypothetical protein
MVDGNPRCHLLVIVVFSSLVSDCVSRDFLSIRYRDIKRRSVARKRHEVQKE